MSKKIKIFGGLGSFLGLFFLVAYTAPRMQLFRPLFFGDAAMTCPFGGSSHRSPLELDIRREAEAEFLRGPGQAKHHKMLGLTLNQSVRVDIAAWASARGLSCREEAKAQTLQCSAAAPSSVAPDFSKATALTVMFELNRHDILKSMKLIADFPSAPDAAGFLQQSLRTMTLQIGAPHETAGEATSAFLASGTFRQARAKFHSQDLFAKLSALTLSANHFTVIHSLKHLVSD